MLCQKGQLLCKDSKNIALTKNLLNLTVVFELLLICTKLSLFSYEKDFERLLFVCPFWVSVSYSVKINYPRYFEVKCAVPNWKEGLSLVLLDRYTHRTAKNMNYFIRIMLFHCDITSTTLLLVNCRFKII